MRSILQGNNGDDLLTLKNTQEAWQAYSPLFNESTKMYITVPKIGRHRIARPQRLNEHALMLVKKKAEIFKKYCKTKSKINYCMQVYAIKASW